MITKKVICVETNKVFDSIKDASNQLNIDKTSIGKVCRGIYKKAGGYTFKYLNDYEAKTNKVKETKSVICIETNKVFISIAEAGRIMNIDPSSIGKVCRGVNKTAKGYTFKFYDEVNKDKVNLSTQELTVNELNEPIELKDFKPDLTIKENKKRILCIETNEIFNSIGEASRKLNIDRSSIGKVCNNKLKSAGGYTFKYITEQDEWFEKYLKDSKYNNYEEWYKAIKHLWEQIQIL